MADNVEKVRRLWAAFESGGMDAVYDIVDDDVEWAPYGAGGAVYRGKEGLREYMEGRRERGEQTDARLYSAFAKGDAVVARGEVRIQSPNGIVTMQPGWLYEFRDGKLTNFRGFPTQDAAMRAAGFAPVDAPAIVREVWDAASRKDVARLTELCAEDVVWQPYNGSRPVYHGRGGVAQYYDEKYAETASIQITEYGIREFGPELVLFTGSLHTVDSGSNIAQRQIHYLFWVSDGRVTRAQSFAQRIDAISAAEAATRSAPG